MMGDRTEQPRQTARGESAHVGMFANPLDFIAEDHMREREVCASIDRIVAGMPVDESEFQSVLTFLEFQLPQHLADEEIDLFPMVLNRCEAEDEIDKVIGKLQSDHTHASADAPCMVDLICTLAKSQSPTQSDCKQMTDFAHHSRRHLILENAIVLPIARGRLTREDLSVMKRHMLERRGLQTPEDVHGC